MNIFSNTVVTLTYKLFSASGELIEESTQPITYLHGGHHGIFPKVEAALAQKTVGDQLSVTLEPEDAFGEYDADLVRIEPQDRFPPEVKVGMQFEGAGGRRRSGRSSCTRSPISPTARSSSTATISWPDSACASIARSSTCGRRRRKRSRTATCTARTATTTDPRS